MSYDFDRIIERRHSDSIKWRLYDEDVLPLWVADMDFLAPEPVTEALAARVQHGVFGYAQEPPELREALVAWLARGDGVLVQTPVYPPILSAPANQGLVREDMQLSRDADGRYSVDDALMAATVSDRTRLFLLCSPQNPTGRTFSDAELGRMADLCLSRGVTIVSDEIHGDLVHPDARHRPIASLSPEVGAATITLMAPSKTFNIPTLGFSLAIIENPGLRKAFRRAMSDIVPHVGALAYTGALAAYTQAESWLDACMTYLAGNRDFLVRYIAEHLPGIHMWSPEATYLAWLDCREADLPGGPYNFFLEHARVALNDGAAFGEGGAGFVRLNFGCPRATLVQALERMRAALDAHRAARQ
ncbi:MAG: Cystathionine beta-lyase PatB [Chloroflexi bacterium ADurb.Bin325]|nr:MAG: Cystathionine beta-lyase PatB [Chloroflexi bacterium ADurb.Bin325]